MPPPSAMERMASPRRQPLADNSVLINGVNAISSTVLSTPLAGLALPAPDAIENLRSRHNSTRPGFGLSKYSGVNLVMKRGTNHLHGDIYEFFAEHKDQPGAERAPESGACSQAESVWRNSWRADPKDKAFFFVSYQGTRQINGYGCGVHKCGVPSVTSRRPQ